MSYSVKSIRKEFAAKGVFYTPPELALKIKSFVDIDTDEVYDPTCGDGGLLRVFPDSVRKYGQELDLTQAPGWRVMTRTPDLRQLPSSPSKG